eukprot:1158410-Pelagomonas_calceolata.AAC.11
MPGPALSPPELYFLSQERLPSHCLLMSSNDSACRLHALPCSGLACARTTTTMPPRNHAQAREQG